jgi:hypothetical protein
MTATFETEENAVAQYRGYIIRRTDYDVWTVDGQGFCSLEAAMDHIDETELRIWGQVL